MAGRFENGIVYGIRRSVTTSSIRLLNYWYVSAKSVSDARLSHDVLWLLWIGLELLTKHFHIDPQIARIGGALRAPHFADDMLLSDDQPVCRREAF
jgi:hypothetical protein